MTVPGPVERPWQRQTIRQNQSILAALDTLVHDGRNVIATVQTAAQNLNAALSEVDRSRQSDVVLTGLHHLGRLLETMKGMVSIETASVTVSLRWALLADVVQAARHLVQPTLHLHAIKCG